MDWSELRVYMEAAKRYPLLTAQEERSLIATIRAGGPDAAAARERFITSNLRLVVSVVRTIKNSAMSVNDLVQEGNIGLIRAMGKFDPARGCRFSTYATYWIRQTMTRATQRAPLIHVPVYQIETGLRIRRAEHELSRRSPHGVTDDHVAHRLGIDVSTVTAYKAIPYVSASLDEPVADHDILYVEALQEENRPTAEAEVSLQEIRDRWEDLFEGIPMRDRRVFELRFGEESLPLAEIGQTLGLTRERIRQILLKYMPMLREKACALGMV